MPCTWEEPWVGECGDIAAVGTDPPRCETHKGKGDCVVCGATAVKGCSATMGLVCGAPLCDDHTLNDCPRH